MIFSPPALFFLIWVVVLFLYSLRLSLLLQPLNAITIIFILSSSFLFFLGWLSSSLFYKQKIIFKIKLNLDSYQRRLSSERINRKFIRVLYFWLILSFIETIYYGNLPLLSALNIGAKLRYTEYGFPGVHGFLNSLFFLFCIYFMSNYLFSKNKKSLIIFLLLLFWPLLVLHRMMIIAVFIQLAFSYLIIFRVQFSLKKYSVILILVLLVLLLFGHLGDLRNGREHILRLADFKSNYPDWLPSGFAWFYLYLTTPLNNINYSLSEYITPSIFPFQLTSRVFPSFIRELLFETFGIDNERLLVSNAFNVSTLFLPIVKDFGCYLGSIVFYIIGSLSFILCSKSINEPRYILFWIVLLYSIVISVFSNHMFHLVFWSEAIFGYILLRK